MGEADHHIQLSRERLGFVPVHVRVAAATPGLAETLTAQLISALVDNPIPAPTKVKAFALASRFGPPDTCLRSAVAGLGALGVSGMEVVALLEKHPPATAEEVDRLSEELASWSLPESGWPVPGTPDERRLLDAFAAIDLAHGAPGRIHIGVRRALGPARHAAMVSLLAAIRGVELWTEALVPAELDPDPAEAAEIARLVSEAPVLGALLSGGHIRPPPARPDRTAEAYDRAFLESIVENLPDMVFVKSAAELRFVRFNRAGEELLGFRRDELIGKNDYDFFPKDEADFFTAKDREVLASGTLLDIHDEPIQTRHKGLRILHTKKIPIMDHHGNARYLLGISEDITEHKRTAAALEEHARELERSNRDLEQFAYAASHDLKEPLRMIGGYSQLLARRYRGKLDKDADEFIGFLVDGVARMERLIDDLLAYSRAGTSQSPFGPVDARDAFQRALANLDAAVKESEAVVSVKGRLPVVEADATQLTQVLQNLIGNGIKFRSGPSPRIHVSARDHEDEHELIVEDDGIGIEARYLDRIFVIFQRLHASDRYPGTGIGLAICRKIVERHGGRIWAESTPGKGSRFHFTIAKRARP